MIKRRVRRAGLPAEVCAYSFRGMGITEYLGNGATWRWWPGSPVMPRLGGRGSTTSRPARPPPTRSNASTSEERLWVADLILCRALHESRKVRVDSKEMAQ